MILLDENSLRVARERKPLVRLMHLCDQRRGKKILVIFLDENSLRIVRERKPLVRLMHVWVAREGERLRACARMTNRDGRQRGQKWQS